LASIANLFPQPALSDPENQEFSSAFASAGAVTLRRMISWRGVAKKRRAQELAAMTVKSSLGVAAWQQSWRDGNHLVRLPERPFTRPQSPGAMRPSRA
jgi:hypothetical protein